MEVNVTNSNIEEILKESKPIVIDFWAEWCGPCRMLMPKVEEVAHEYEGKAIIAKCNVDEADEVAAKYGIRNIPTLIYIKNGEIVDRTVGAVQKSEITSRIDNLL